MNFKIKCKEDESKNMEDIYNTFREIISQQMTIRQMWDSAFNRSIILFDQDAENILSKRLISLILTDFRRNVGYNISDVKMHLFASEKCIQDFLKHSSIDYPVSENLIENIKIMGIELVSSELIPLLTTEYVENGYGFPPKKNNLALFNAEFVQRDTTVNYNMLCGY